MVGVAEAGSSPQAFRVASVAQLKAKHSVGLFLCAPERATRRAQYAHTRCQLYYSKRVSNYSVGFSGHFDYWEFSIGFFFNINYFVGVYDLRVYGEMINR